MLDPRLQPYDFDLPQSLIARYPPANRDGGRLLELRERGPVDRRVIDLPRCLEPGDLLVVNNTKVLSARLAARRATGGAVEALLLHHLPDAAGTVPAMLRPGRRLKEGEVLAVEADGQRVAALTLVRRCPAGTWRVALSDAPLAVMDAAGQIPLPPYLRRAAEQADAERYQTVYAGPLGAVAAPTAGLHLSAGVLADLKARGVQRAEVTLHVGAGTFRNLRSADLDAGLLHPESFSIPPQTAAAVAQTRARGGRVVAVGTTSTRCLESAALPGRLVAAGEGVTRLFIQPGRPFAVVDSLLTNFHLPRSSLLMLACALGGRERVLAAYRHAVAAGYRFFSYGDAMLIDPEAR